MATPAIAPGTRAGRSRSADVAAFVAGGLAAALAIAVGELMAGLISGAPSLVIAIGDFVIAHQPPGGKELFVSLFGQSDKLALNVLIVAAAVLVAGLLGVGGRRSFAIPTAGFAAAGAVGLFAALSQPLTEPLPAIVTVALAVAVALVALRLMLLPTGPAWATRPASATTIPTPAMPDWDRRRFIQRSGGVAVGSVVLGLLGRNLLESRSVGQPVVAAQPLSTSSLLELPAGASLDVPGITPIVVPNDEFYRIDTALFAPRVDAADWELRIVGMVDREVRLSYADLAAMTQLEQSVTIACVSNEVGGRLVGNALWRGVDLREVLDMAGVQPGADQIVGRSVDGFTAGFPTSWALDPERRPMIALGMNGEALPVDHGYPARLIVPGLYGYVSATKWLIEIELTTWDGFDGYWVPLGWAKEAPILTQSRIDVPRHGSTVAAGSPVAIAGVAWAPDRGVRAVEVSVDGGAWQPARTSAPLNDATWVQWLLTWTPDQPGQHRLSVRATDGEGVVQTDEVTSPAPDGARGHHTIEVSAT
jgi:DMSO/TMAO reductase YedYZ molybdopterin-dependent catalytic subunit